MAFTFAIVTLVGSFLSFAVDAASLLDFLSTSGGVKVAGAASSKAGTNVRMIGDYNKDGKQDFAIAAPLMTVDSKATCGMVLIVLGKDGAWSEIDMSTAASGLSIQRVIGALAGDNAGSAIGPAGDVNGDGVDDVLIGAQEADIGKSNTGIFYVLFGKATTSAYADIDLASFITTSTAGFTISGLLFGDRLGCVPINVRPLGDVNGDKIDDFAVTTPIGEIPDTLSGSAWILYGNKTTSNIDLANLGNDGVLLSGRGNSEFLGWSIDGVGDFNGDGLNDVLIGEYQHTSDSKSNRGAAYLLYGSSSLMSMAVPTLVTGPLGIRFLGGTLGEYVGKSVAGAGDINGDGKMDILIGATGARPKSRSGAGNVYVIYGTSAQLSADVDLSTILAGNLGFSVNGALNSDSLGLAVSRGGDLDQDGYDDFVVGRKTTVYVLYGSATTYTADIDLKGYGGRVMSFVDVAPESISAGLDVTGDGIPDLLVGAPTSDTNAGAAYMVKGPIVPPTVMPTKAPTIAPTRKPTRSPTCSPSLLPTTQPSLMPSPLPSALSTELPTGPSMAPTFEPSILPSALPSVMPSAQSSIYPSMLPSTAPSDTPSLMPTAPSVVPSEAPTLSPTPVPTQILSVPPTVRPTLTFQEVVLDVQQDVYFINKEDYDAQKLQCNKTIQHTVADQVPGVVPERVTDIVVEEEEEEGGKVGNMRAAAVTRPRVSLKYKVTVYDPLFSAAFLSAQLKAKVLSGDMENAFRAFAVIFNATSMRNITFGEPLVTNLIGGETSFNDPPTDNELAGLVIGSVLFVALLTVGVWLLVIWL